MKTKKLKCIFLVIIFLTTFLAGVSVAEGLAPAGRSFAASEDSEIAENGDLTEKRENPVIRISTWYHQEDLTYLREYLYEQFPDYTFEYYYVDKSNYEPVVDSQLSYKGASDILFMDQEMIQKHAATGYILNVTDLCSDFNNDAWKAFGYGNAMYAVPDTSQFECIYYNKDLFSQKGVDVPYSFFSFTGSCERFKEAGIRPLSVSLKNPYALANSALAFVAADYFSADRGSGFGGRLQYGRTTFTKEITPYIGDWEELLKHDIFSMEMYTIDSLTAIEEFSGGEAAMIAGEPETYNAIIRQNPDMNIGTLPFYGSRGKLKAVIGGCDVGLAINKNSPNVELAWEVLESLTTLSGQMALWKDRPGSQTYLKDTEFVNSEVYDGLTECVQEGLVFSPWMDWGRELNGPIHAQLGRELQKVLMKKQTTEEAFKNVDDAVYKILTDG
jgi:multiple sugar transport system substrate-binding protein